ncbi:MAG: hypothetical protein WCV79_01030 [Candidatus Paceibacterota bacterium]
MGERVPTHEALRAVMRSVSDEGGSATHRGEQRHREGRGLDPLVDPKGFDVIRHSRNRFEKTGEHYVLTVAQAILKETRFDTTGSMGNNVQLAFEALPRSYHLLKEISNAPLGRYDLQIINSIFGDVQDSYVLCRSQAEMDEKIAEQLRLMVPQSAGGDSDEDPQYGLFGAAYLTAASIVKVGLKTYDFTVTDARGRSRLDSETLVRVFGENVFDRVKDNGYQIKKGDLPTTKDVVRDLLKIAHAFLIQVGSESQVNRFWIDIYGRDRVIVIPDVRYLPEVESAIVGLTEGTVNLQSIEDFLVKEAQISATVANTIRRAVAGIPIGAQAALPNFMKIPFKGAKFANKTDAWPIGYSESGEPTALSKAKVPEKEKGKKIWL